MTDKRRALLHGFSRILSLVPYETIETKTVKLPKRKTGRSQTAEYPFRYVTEHL